MDIQEFAKLGGLARAKKLGKKGLSEANTKAINARWDKYRALKANSTPVASLK